MKYNEQLSTGYNVQVLTELAFATSSAKALADPDTARR